MSQRTCSVDGCGSIHRARGFCKYHYDRAGLQPLPVVASAERFWSKVEPTGCCWLWTGRIEEKGYGIVDLPAGPPYRAHRRSWELLVGPIPEKMTLDHICRVRHCVNPDHLQIVTQAENTTRAMRHVQHSTILRARRSDTADV